MPDIELINNTIGKMGMYFENHKSICVSISGGSDSDIMLHMIVTNYPQYLDKVRFVFANTGLEYKATLEHLTYLENKYGIKINRVRGKSVVTVTREYGIPLISKLKSKHLGDYVKGVSYAVRMIENPDGYYGPRFKFSKNQTKLALAVKERNIKVSAKCCDISKKKPMIEFHKSVECDMFVTGERAAEGGVRGMVHKSCFEEKNHGKFDKYMPLFFWDDETKAYYKEKEGIRYSDCYEVWGMKRTGCVGCPFNSRAGDDLRIVKEHEPNLHKACLNVFGMSYRLQDEFHINRHRILPDNNGIEDE